MRIRQLEKSYQVSGQRLEVLKGLDLDLPDQGITVVLGRSGCGKTTLLRLIAGLEQADSGQILLDGEQKIGVIFQEPRLMPWLTVERNILFGVGKKSAGKLGGLLSLTGLSGFAQAYPAQLSGGMKQRVALARALAYEPDYLLMDEPFAALDYFTRAQMQRELLRIYQSSRVGILFVTHSIEEALTIGTRILILEDGRCGCCYDLERILFPRDLLSEEMIQVKREIISRIEE